jgi:predicted PurR-regulated permease PerM
MATPTLNPIRADVPPPEAPEPLEPVVIGESAPAEVVTSGEVAAAPPAERWMGERTRTVSMVIVALVAGGAALWFLKGTLTPLLIALFMYYLLKPLTDALNRARIPRWISAPAVALVLFVALVAFGQALYSSITSVSANLDVYRNHLVDRLDTMLQWVGYRPNPETGVVFDHKQLDAFFEGLWKDHSPTLAGGLMMIIEVTLMALFYLLFLFIEVQSLPRRIWEAFRADTAADAQTMGQEVNDQVKRYLQYKTLISLGLGLTHGGICWLTGLDFALLWGASMFLLNYITYIGSIVALVPPVLLAVVQFNNPWAGLGLAAVLTVNRLVWVDYIEIRYLGNVLNISPLVMLLSIAFFGALWGPVGLLLAVPLMTSLKIVLAYYQNTRHIAVLISEEAAENGNGNGNGAAVRTAG